MIGNPASSPKIRELYRQVIAGQESPTHVSARSTAIRLNGLQKGKKNMTVFTLKNTGDQPLVISSVNASCGCTKPVWDRKPVASGQNTAVMLEIQPDEAVFFHKTVQVHFNTEKESIAFAMIHNESTTSFSFKTGKAILTIDITGEVKE
jgi:hypothetical protein